MKVKISNSNKCLLLSFVIIQGFSLRSDSDLEKFNTYSRSANIENNTLAKAVAESGQNVLDSQGKELARVTSDLKDRELRFVTQQQLTTLEQQKVDKLQKSLSEAEKNLDDYADFSNQIAPGTQVTNAALAMYVTFPVVIAGLIGGLLALIFKNKKDNALNAAIDRFKGIMTEYSKYENSSSISPENYKALMAIHSRLSDGTKVEKAEAVELFKRAVSASASSDNNIGQGKFAAITDVLDSWAVKNPKSMQRAKSTVDLSLSLYKPKAERLYKDRRDIENADGGNVEKRVLINKKQPEDYSDQDRVRNRADDVTDNPRRVDLETDSQFFAKSPLQLQELNDGNNNKSNKLSNSASSSNLLNYSFSKQSHLPAAVESGKDASSKNTLTLRASTNSMGGGKAVKTVPKI